MTWSSQTGEVRKLRKRKRSCCTEPSIVISQPIKRDAKFSQGAFDPFKNAEHSDVKDSIDLGIA